MSTDQQNNLNIRTTPVHEPHIRFMIDGCLIGFRDLWPRQTVLRMMNLRVDRNGLGIYLIAYLLMSVLRESTAIVPL